MLKAEIYRIIKSKKSLILIGILFCIPLIDLLLCTYQVYKEYIWHSEYYPKGFPQMFILHPCFASFLAGSTQGHIMQMLYIWIFPLYILIIYSDTYLTEKKYGVINFYLTRVNRTKYLLTKFFISFVLPFLISFFSVGINFILSFIIFNNGKYLKNYDNIAANYGELGVFSIQHPVWTYLIYLLIFCFVSGGCGVICTGICLLSKKNKMSYTFSILIWLFLLMLPDSLIYLVQPFTEYNLENCIPISIIYLLIVFGIGLISFKYKVNCDEL